MSKLGEGATPGEWTYGANTQEIWCSGGGKTIAKVGYGNSPIPKFPHEKTEQDANGRLIAKAKLLVEARDVLARLTDERCMNAARLPDLYRSELRALLAKLEAE